MTLSNLNPWQAYIISILLGLLVGLERERAHPHQKSMGIRTFLMISILGAIAGDNIPSWIGLLISLFVFTLIGISYYFENTLSQNRSERGLTTEFAAGIIFCLSYISHSKPILSALLGPIVAFILFSKVKLHRFSHALKSSELEAALVLILAAVTVISIAPDKFIDPWNIFNPKKFGVLILILGTIEFASYFLIKLLGEKKGVLVVGFLGGLVSSTAVLLSSLKQTNKAPPSWKTYLISTIAAKTAAIAELFVIILFIAPNIFNKIILPLGLGISYSIFYIYFLQRNLVKQTAILESERPQINLKSPLDWKGVLRLSLLFAAILGAISFAKVALGESASYALSFLTGLFELHGVTLANSTLFIQDQISLETASLSILLAYTASLTAKLVISWFLNQKSFSKHLTLAFVPMIVIALSTWLWV